MAKSFNDLPASIQGAVLVTVALVLAGGTFWYFALPLYDQRDGLQKEVAKLKADNDKNEAFRQQQTEYLNRIKQLESQLETLRSIVPDEQATDEFMKTVFADGASTGTQVRTFVPKPPAVKDYYIEIPFTVRLDGTYYNLLSFFDRLSHEQRIMSVSGLTLGSPEGGGMGTYKVSSTETVGANCMLTTYYNKPLTAAAPPPKKK
ncbi:MAG TPA: type 4a pilus biogenesis protein PilO [Terriglobia bacterium]|nr:type 4a pilus biogenesis protein PilO [Terriglobia bacterium]